MYSVLELISHQSYYISPGLLRRILGTSSDSPPTPSLIGRSTSRLASNRFGDIQEFFSCLLSSLALLRSTLEYYITACIRFASPCDCACVCKSAICCLLYPPLHSTLPLDQQLLGQGRPHTNNPPDRGGWPTCSNNYYYTILRSTMNT